MIACTGTRFMRIALLSVEEMYRADAAAARAACRS